MGNPTIFSGRYTKLLTNQGILNSNGSVNNYDGTKNYIPYAQFEQNITTGWSLFNTSLTSGLPTGTVSAGAASITTFATTGTNPLAGSYSLQIAGSAAISAGQGFISSAFTVDRCDYGKVLTFKFCYEAVTNPTNANWSGQLGSQSFAVYIYDVTAAAWVQPTGFLGMNQSLNSGQVTGTFQSSVVSGQQYQIAVICLQATAGAITINFDSISVSPQVNPIGAAMTDWTNQRTLTPVNFGTITNASWITRRVGDSLEVFGYFTGTTPVASVASFTLPSGLNIDTTKLPSGSGGTIVGGYSATTSAGTNISTAAYYGYVFYDGSTSGSLYVAQSTNTSANAKSLGSGILASGQNVTVEFKIPIAGWSSNVQMSNDTDTRVVTALIQSQASNYSMTANTAISWNGGAIFDTHGAFNGTTTYTVPVSGYYEIKLMETLAGATCYFQVAKNGVLLNTTGTIGYYNPTGSAGVQNGSTIDKFNAGDAITIIPGTSTTLNYSATNYRAKWSVTRVTGPSVIAANELISAKYYASANGTATSTTPVNYDSKIYDSHNAVTTGSAWKFTAPRSGKYSLKSYLNNASAPLSTCLITIYKNGANLEVFGDVFVATPSASMSTSFSLNAGDTIQITSNNANYPWQGGTYGTVTGAAPCVIEIESLGY